MKIERPKTKEEKVERIVAYLAIILALITYVCRMVYSRLSTWKMAGTVENISRHQFRTPPFLVTEVIALAGVEVMGLTVYYSFLLLSISKCYTDNFTVKPVDIESQAHPSHSPDKNIKLVTVPECSAPTAVVNTVEPQYMMVPQNQEMTNPVQFFQNKELQIQRSQHIYPTAPTGIKNLKNRLFLEFDLKDFYFSVYFRSQSTMLYFPTEKSAFKTIDIPDRFDCFTKFIVTRLFFVKKAPTNTNQDIFKPRFVFISVKLERRLLQKRQPYEKHA